MHLTLAEDKQPKNSPRIASLPSVMIPVRMYLKIKLWGPARTNQTMLALWTWRNLLQKVLEFTVECMISQQLTRFRDCGALWAGVTDRATGLFHFVLSAL